jgi:hypothetical protein
MRRAVVAWLLFWVGFGLLDYAADRRGKSLCHAVRHLFRTNTCAGSAAFTATFGTGAFVLWRHVLKR